ncbi:GDSL lipase/esterase - like 10 [Theobroma cacao]|nr:GDSL lipase/esterase - like 10 [Theobroma cacao]
MALMNIPWIFFVQILVLASKSEAKVSAIIAFGDSFVDSGNNNYIPTIAKCNFEPYGRDFPGGTPTGRFCNGCLPPDFISEGFGLKPIIPAYLGPTLNISDFASGVCFASAATGYDNATADVLWSATRSTKRSCEPIWVIRRRTGIISEALYLISIGTNDFLENYYALPEIQSQFTVQEYEDFLIGIAENFVRQIYGLGARKMSLTGLPPIGCLPVQRATNFEDPLNCVEERNKVALEFNGKLKLLVAKLDEDLPGLKDLRFQKKGVVAQGCSRRLFCAIGIIHSRVQMQISMYFGMPSTPHSELIKLPQIIYYGRSNHCFFDFSNKSSLYLHQFPTMDDRMQDISDSTRRNEEQFPLN